MGDDEDGLLERHLDALDVYSAAHSELCASLRRAFFELARSRQAMPRASLLLAPRHLPSRAIAIDDVADDVSYASFSLTHAPAAPSAQDARAQPADEQQVTATGLRRRTNKDKESTGSTTDDDDDGSESSRSALTPVRQREELAGGKTPRDPIYHLSPMPPPCLRLSQAHFVHALSHAVRAVQAQSELAARENKVRSCRRAHEMTEDSGAEASSRTEVDGEQANDDASEVGDGKSKREQELRQQQQRR